MCILIMNRIRALVAGIGFIVMGVLLSGVLPPHVLPAVQMFRGEIFRTNCLLMFAKSPFNGDSLSAPPASCNLIEQWIPSLLIANGVILILFGITRWCAVISILNLCTIVLFYCNPFIDASMRNYSHFLKVFICLASFMIILFRDEKEADHGKAKTT